MKISEYSRKTLNDCAHLYATYENMSYAECANHMHLPVSTFQKLVERAIIERVCSDHEVDIIDLKAQRNCAKHGGNGGAINAHKKYERLRAMRSTYTLPNSEKYRLVRLFSLTEGVKISEFSQIHYVPEDLMMDAIQTSITEVLINDKELNWLLDALIMAADRDDRTASRILIVCDHLLDIREKNESEKKEEKQLSIWARP